MWILGSDIFGSDISNLNGLSVITSIGGELLILDCNILGNLTGLDNLTSIGGAQDSTMRNPLGLDRFGQSYFYRGAHDYG